MSRCRLRLLACLAACAPAIPASAQAELEAQSGDPPDQINILVERQIASEERYEECEEDQDAATITGEIVVCRRRSDDDNRLYDKESAEQRHAERTQGQQPVGLFGIPDHGVVVARGCFIPPCPKPMPILIDIKALPEAPPGSDADRIGRGLAPRGNQAGIEGAAEPVTGDAQLQSNADQLGLPPPLEEAGPDRINPSESASPEAEPSG